MRVLLDTCVLSEIRRPKGHLRVRRAVEALNSEDLFLSVISIGEIAKGIALLKDTKKKHDLLIWMQALETYYADRVLAVDQETSHIHVMTRNTEHFNAAGVLLLDAWAGQEP